MLVIWNIISALPSLCGIVFQTDLLCFLFTFLLLSQRETQYWIISNYAWLKYAQKKIGNMEK